MTQVHDDHATLDKAARGCNTAYKIKKEETMTINRRDLNLRWITWCRRLGGLLVAWKNALSHGPEFALAKPPSAVGRAHSFVYDFLARRGELFQ